MKLWNRASRGQSSCPALALLLPSSFHPLLPRPPARIFRRPSLSAATYRSSYPSSSCSASPFLLHKITEATERAAVTQRGTQPAGPAVAGGAQLARGPAPFRWLVCPLPTPLSPVSRCGPSAAGGAIGKQRPKMRFPVSFSSLTNK